MPDVVFFRDVSLLVVAAESDEVIRNGRIRAVDAVLAFDDDAFLPTEPVVAVASDCSLHDEVLSLPCDGVSDTRLCVSSKPSSFSSC